MSRFDSFAATVGVLLLENLSGLPSQAPAPQALLRARGWYQPGREGPCVLTLLPADDLDDGAIARVVVQWRSWLDGLGALDAALVLVFERGLPNERTAAPLSADGPRLIWPIDLGGSEPAAPEGLAGRPFLEQAFDGIAAFYQGVHHTPEDLLDVEQSSLAGKQPFSIFLNDQHAPASWILLALLGAFYLIELGLGGSINYKMLRAGAINAPLVQQGEIWRLASAMFLHFDVVHLGVNAFSLMAVGPFLERLFGTRKFLAIYLFAGLAGAVASCAFNQNGISAGASGALSGLLGAMLVLGVRYRGSIPAYQRRALGQAGLAMLVLTIGVGFAVPHIDNSAHMGGLVGGFALAALVGPHPALLGRRPRRWSNRLLFLVPLVTALGLVASLIYLGSGRVPDMETSAPTRDFVTRVPLDQIYFNGRALDVSADHDLHWVRLESADNPAGPDPVTEFSLERHADPLTRRYAVMGAALAIAPTVITAGNHRFLRLVLILPDGEHEEVYVTATHRRLFTIRTFGLEARSWVRPTLVRALATFEMRAG